MSTSRVHTRVLAGFDDPFLGPERWAKLLSLGETDTMSLTWPWQRAWWGSFGRGRLLLITAEREGNAVACAPLFADGGMIFNLCPEDRLDFLGDIGDPEVLDALLLTARQQVSDFVGFRFYFIPDESSTGQRLQEAARRIGLRCWDEGSLPSPWIDITGRPDEAVACTRKKSLIRHERSFLRDGALKVCHLRETAVILPQLPVLFEQHVSRRAATPHPSLYLDPARVAYWRHLVTVLGPTGWLRFTRVDWNDRPIAFHLGHCYRGRYMLGIPTFSIDLAQRSPGEVLLRQLLLAAIHEGADCFDFGIGDEGYKYRFATHVRHLRTWGLYPAETVGSDYPPGERAQEPVSGNGTTSG